VLLNGLLLEVQEFLGDFIGGENQFPEEPLEIINEQLLVAEELLDADAVQLNRALQVPHEGLGAVRQRAKAFK
jgi:hypothetical protein